MGSAKQDMAVSQLMTLLHEWDNGSKSTRRKILQDFIAQNHARTGPELEAELAEGASLFLARLNAWLSLTYMIGTCLYEQLRAIRIFVSAASGHKFVGEFIEVGCLQTVVQILGVKQAKDADKTEALELLMCLANAGRQYKELICESYGIRAVAECLAKSRSEQTQETARRLLQTLAEGNPKFQGQVYRGLIALLPCSTPRAQQMAAQTLRVVQPIVGTAHPSIVEPLLNLLKTLHLEVQYEAMELIQLLMEYDVRDALLQGLVKLLRPAKEDTLHRPEILNDVNGAELTEPLPVFIQQAAAAKCIWAVSVKSEACAKQLVELQVVTNLMFAMGNMDYRESQRQAAKALEFFCRSFDPVAERVHDAMGDTLYDTFMAECESLFAKLTAVQADILVSNKTNITPLAITNGHD